MPFDAELWPLLARLEQLYSRSGGVKSFSSTALRRIFEPLCGAQLQKHDAKLQIRSGESRARDDSSDPSLRIPVFEVRMHEIGSLADSETNRSGDYDSETKTADSETTIQKPKWPIQQLRFRNQNSPIQKPSGSRFRNQNSQFRCIWWWFHTIWWLGLEVCFWCG